MAYFPESIMPERRKDQTEDIPGNPHVVNASDINKHVDEIIAIEKVIGPTNPNFPVNYSGMGSASGFSGFSGNPYSFSSASTTPNMLRKLNDVLDKLREIREGMLLTTSGVVCILDPKVTGEDGKIIFPTNWPTTTLVTPMADDQKAYDSDQVIDTIPYIELTDVSDMPDSGYVSIINEVEWKWYYVAPMWRLTTEYSRFANTTEDLLIRRRNISTYVEILRYSGLDQTNNKILNVKRRQLGTTSTPHFASDTVYKGKLSLQVSPSLYVYSTANGADAGNLLYKTIHLQLKQDATIQGYLALQIDGTLKNTGHTLYASYQAQLIRSIDPLTVFEVGTGDC